MCGIAGIISYQNNLSVLQWLSVVSQILQHRGNDDDGICLFDTNHIYCTRLFHPNHATTHSHTLKYLHFTHPSNILQKNFYAGLSHNRLSIIDLSELAHQPMCDETGTVWITYNGEIYNFHEIKKTLQHHGIHFFSNSDTEVVLKAYLHYGKNITHHLNGMWAFAIYNLRTHELFLSRDRLGVKPLYYYHTDKLFAFASEQKAFIKSKLIPFQINEQAIANYLMDNILEDTPEGIFKHIIEIQPGENITVSTKNLTIQKLRYFNIPYLLSQPQVQLENDIIQQTHHIVTHSIHQHLKSDVPVAIGLSGGIDSSIIAVSAAKQSPDPLHTFSIVYPQHPSINEQAYIQSVNQHINSQSHLITPTAEDFFREIDELLYAQDIPIWSTSTYNQFVLMKQVKQSGIKVILIGQGSDELFAGYQHHYVAYWLSLWKSGRLSTFFQHIRSSAPYIPHPYHQLLKSILKNYYSPYKKQIQSYLSKDILNTYTNKHPHQISPHLNTELVRDLSYRRLKAFLKCEDRCSMWHSVESRSPFSDDIHLIQWAFQIPEHLKLKNGISKYVLREAFKSELPDKIYKRTNKLGFNAPLREWLIPYESVIINEIKNGWQELINSSAMHHLKNIQTLSDSQTEIVFKLFLLNRWKKQWSL